MTNQERWLFEVAVTVPKLPKIPQVPTKSYVMGSVRKIEDGWEAEFELGEMQDGEFENIQRWGKKAFAKCALEQVKQLVATWLAQYISTYGGCALSDVVLGEFDWEKSTLNY